jgi:hypothetical protein
MTRSVDQSKAANYLTKAENSLRIAKIALKERAYDTAVMDAVHSSINALDALTTFMVENVRLDNIQTFLS